MVCVWVKESSMLHIHTPLALVINTICCTHSAYISKVGTQRRAMELQKPNKAHCVVHKNVFASNSTHIFRCVYYFCLVILGYLFCLRWFGLAMIMMRIEIFHAFGIHIDFTISILQTKKKNSKCVCVWEGKKREKTQCGRYLHKMGWNVNQQMFDPNWIESSRVKSLLLWHIAQINRKCIIELKAKTKSSLSFTLLFSLRIIHITLHVCKEEWEDERFKWLLPAVRCAFFC